MVRHFMSEPVPKGTIDGILELAQHAPSAGFSQGSAYVVITDPELKKKVARLQGEEDYHAGGFHRWISEAPVAIVACVSEKLYHDRYNEPASWTSVEMRSSGRPHTGSLTSEPGA